MMKTERGGFLVADVDVIRKLKSIITRSWECSLVAEAGHR